jgi:hypothetical protein
MSVGISSSAARSVWRSPALLSAGLVAALVGGFAIGKVGQGSVGRGEVPGAVTSPSQTVPAGHSHGGATASNTDFAGTMVSSTGLTLQPLSTVFQAGVTQPFTFRIVGPDRKPVTTFVAMHDKLLHLVVVGRDLSGFQHLHPSMADDGTWSVPLTLPGAGSWRAYADFVAVGPAGQQIPVALGVDLNVPGDYLPATLPPPAREGSVGALTVVYEGTPQAGAIRPITMRVFSSGAPVNNLQHYLGAYGHLLVVREGDLAYLHIHAEDQLINGGVKFWLAPPSPGRYRAFFEFQAADTVHTAEFTVQVE